jgi:carboxypeptidase Q
MMLRTKVGNKMGPADLFRGVCRYHHTDADTIDKISPEQLQHSAATLGVWIYSIANLPELLPR